MPSPETRINTDPAEDGAEPTETNDKPGEGANRPPATHDKDMRFNNSQRHNCIGSGSIAASRLPAGRKRLLTIMGAWPGADHD